MNGFLGYLVLVAAVSPALADASHRCVITKVDDKETKLEVDAWKKGDRWAEYTCREDGKQLVFKWVAENKACDGKNAVRWVTWFGEKKIESTALCKDVGAKAPPPVASEPAPTGADVHCYVTKVNGQDQKLEVAGANSKRWGEYDCRTGGEKLVDQWAKDNKACANKQYAVKYSMTMGKPGAEKKWDGARLCSSIK